MIYFDGKQFDGPGDLYLYGWRNGRIAEKWACKRIVETSANDKDDVWFACSECGGLVNLTDRFCPSCGRRVME